MTPQTEAAPAKQKEPQYVPQNRLSVVYFDRSVMFGTEMESASVWVPGSSGSAPSNSVGLFDSAL